MFAAGPATGRRRGRPRGNAAAVAQVAHAVVARVDLLPLGVLGLRREDEAPLLHHEEEQQAVDQPQELAVVLRDAQAPSRQGLAQLRTLRVRQEGRAQLLQRLLHAVAQVLPHAPAFLEALLVVLFKPARVRVGAAAREARVVHEAVE